MPQERRLKLPHKRRDVLSLLLLTGASFPVLGTLARAQATPLVLDLGAVRRALGPQASDDDALAQAMANSAPALSIHLPAGGGSGAGGVWEFSTQPWSVPNAVPSRGNITRSRVRIYGDGMGRTIVRQPTRSNLLFMAHVDPARPHAVLTDIAIDSLTLEGNLGRRRDYNEFNHLLQLAGVANMVVNRVEFRDWMGDGISLSSPLRALDYHNTNLQVTDCIFDGVSRRNRNGIGILDCNGWTVTGCTFVNCCDVARNTPGAIDIEPELPTAVVASGTVSDCRFENVGGAAVALLNGHGGKASGLRFTHCEIRNMARGILSVDNFSGVTAAHHACDSVGDPLAIRRSRDVTLRDCTIRNSNMIRIGGLGDTVARNVTIENNRFPRCGNVDGPVIVQDGHVENVQVLGNTLTECGVAGRVSPLYFIQQSDASRARVDGLTLAGNIVEPARSHVTDIGRLAFGYAPAPPFYRRVSRTGNSPAAIPGGAENLVNAR